MSFLKSIFNKTRIIDDVKVETVSFFQTYKDKIYPWVKVTAEDGIPAQIELKEEDALVLKKWRGDLIIFYVFDIGDRFQMLHKRDLPRDLTEEQLHQIAVENLNRDVEYKVHETNF